MCLFAMIFSGILALVALGIFYLLGWVTRLLFGQPPFIFTIIEAYSTVEVTVIFVIGLVGFVTIFRSGEVEKKEGDD